MDNITKALKTELDTLRIRRAIFAAAEIALTNHTGKPIGKRLAAEAKALCADYPEGTAWTSGGPTDFRYLVLSVGSVVERILLGWKAVAVPATVAAEVRGWKESLSVRIEEIEKLLAGDALEGKAQDLRESLAALADAVERIKESKTALPYGATQAIIAEFPDLTSLTSRIY